MWVQIAIVLVSLYLVRLMLTSGPSTISAWKKAGLALLAIAMVVTVFNPALTTWVAQLMGVGRGADLLLYGVTGAFVIYAMLQYIARQKEHDRMIRLARRVALLEAAERYGAAEAPRPALPPPPGQDDAREGGDGAEARG